MAAAAAGGGAKDDVFSVPTALLVRHGNETGDWIVSIFDKISEKLRENNIAVTTDIKDIGTVHLTIVFLNEMFVVNCHHLFDLFIHNAAARKMILHAFVYENSDDPSKLVTEIVNRFHRNCSNDFDFNTSDYVVKERLAKLVTTFFNQTSTIMRKVPNSNIKITNGGGTLESFMDNVVHTLNPFTLDFTNIQPELLSEVVAMSRKIEYVRNLDCRNYQPLLALFEFQPCQEHHCSSQMMSIILKLLYTFFNIFCNHEFQLGRLFISNPPPIGNGEPPPSFPTALNAALKAQYPDYGFGCFYSLPFLIVIDDVQRFVPDKEDPKYMLAAILEKLGDRCLVITWIPNSLELDTKCLGPVLGTPRCTHSPLNTIGPVCYTIFCEELVELAMETFVGHEADINEAVLSAAEDERKKKFHSIVFDVAGNEQKRLREAY